MALVAEVRESKTDSKRINVHEFFSQTETLTKVSCWTDQAKAKLEGLALQYLNGKEELGRVACGHETFGRLSGKLPDCRKRPKGRKRAQRILVTGAENCVKKQFEDLMMRLHKEKSLMKWVNRCVVEQVPDAGYDGSGGKVSGYRRLWR